MMWGDLVPTIERILDDHFPPDFIIVQLGSNDLGVRSGFNLIQNIEIDLLRLNVLLPSTKIIWSDILQRRYWHRAMNGKAIEMTRKRVNSAVKSIVLSIGGRIIRHSNILAREIYLYRHDGTHLSDAGLGVYLNTIQGALETFLTSSSNIFPCVS